MPLVERVRPHTTAPNDAQRDTPRDTPEHDHERVERLFFTELGELLERDVRGLVALASTR